MTAGEKVTLTRIEASLSNKINEIYSLKEDIEELKVTLYEKMLKLPILTFLSIFTNLLASFRNITQKRHGQMY